MSFILTRPATISLSEVFMRFCWQQILGSRGDMEAKIEEKTKQQIDEIALNVSTHREEAMQKLLKLVCDIKPELHQNFRP